MSHSTRQKPFIVPEQHLKEALKKRLSKKPEEGDETRLIAHWLRCLFLSGKSEATMEGILEELCFFAHTGLGLKRKAQGNWLDEAERAALFVALEKRLAQAQKKTDQSSLDLVLEPEKALDAQATFLKGGALFSHKTPWDARHDGHLLSRSKAYALGLIRWATSLTPDRAARLSSAFLHAKGLPTRSLYAFNERRVLLVIDSLDLFHQKLVHDAWLTEPSIAVVLVNETSEMNPFSTLGVPLIVDDKHHLQALLGLDWFPALVEPIFGGVSVTASSGLIEARAMPATLPAFWKTFSEIGLLKRRALFEEFLPQKEAASAKKRYRLLAAWTALLEAAPTQPDRALSPEAKNVMGEKRKDLIEVRSRITASLKAFEQKVGKEQHLLKRSRRRS